MRDKAKTIEALRRLAERPGTPEEGETAKRLLDKLGAVSAWVPLPFHPSMFPRGTRVYYCYWAYRNSSGTIVSDSTKSYQDKIWIRIKFDHLKHPRWVPITSPLGCHLGLEPFSGDVAETLYRMDVDWKIKDEEFFAEMLAHGFDVRKKWYDKENDNFYTRIR